MKPLILCAAVGCLAATAASAEVYDFTFSNSTDTISGQFATSTAAPSVITAITGVFDGSAITGLSSYAAADNTLYSTTPLYFSLGGVSFNSVGGSYNIYAYNGGDYLLKSSVDPVGYPQNGQLLTTAIVAVPEPATWTMMIVGLLGVGALVRRRAALVAAA